MKKLPFKKIDAFAAGKSGGNPAGAVYLNTEQDLSSQDMQRIAGELKGFVNEVGFILRAQEDVFVLKYYSSEREVDFCGHATIAIMHDLLKNNDELLKKPFVYILTNKGQLLVENRIKEEDAVFISAPFPRFSDHEISKESLAEALSIEVAAFHSDYPVSIVNAGLETLIVPICSLQAILSISPLFEELKHFCENSSVDIITVFTPEVSDKANAFRTRVFAPRFGYLEDPATGSGNAAFGNYLLRNRRWDGGCISVEQNGSAAQANIVKLATKQKGLNKPEVVFGGSAILRIKGEYYLT